MSSLRVLGALVLALNAILGISANHVSGIISFGDSLLDVGNNNYLATAGPLARCNQLPYGRIFDTGMPTGRFTDGELVSDIVAKSFNLPFAPAYLDPNAKGVNLTKGVNFASGGAGILNSTSMLQGVASFELQILWFRDYYAKLRAAVGRLDAADIIEDALYFVSAGANDYAYKPINPAEALTDPAVFKQRLLDRFTQYIKEIYSIGARKFIIFSLPPLGCIPAIITLQGDVTRRCVDSLNNLASDYNLELKNTLSFLKSKLPLAKFIYVDGYSLTLDLVQNPSKYGFTVTNRGCCGTGLSEIGISCNQASVGTCADASKYVFFDAAHSTFATYRIVSAQLMSQLRQLK